jgi:hypothetical protein
LTHLIGNSKDAQISQKLFFAGKVFMHFLKLATHRRGRISSFLRLLLLILPLSFITPQAKAAAITTCQDGAATTVDGTIFKVLRGDTTWFYINGSSLDCGPVYIETANAQTCVLRSQIHASGTLSKPVSGSSRVEWSLTNPTFSCQ